RTVAAAGPARDDPGRRHPAACRRIRVRSIAADRGRDYLRRCIERDRLSSKSPSRPTLLLEHDLFRKPAPPRTKSGTGFRDHVLAFLGQNAAMRAEPGACAERYGLRALNESLLA